MTTTTLTRIEDPSKLDTTFIYEGEDAVYLVQYDSEGASGDGYEEPRSEAHAWIHRLWIAAKPTFEKYRWDRKADGTFGSKRILEHTDGTDWVEIPVTCLSKGLTEAIEDEAHGHAFPGPPCD